MYLKKCENYFWGPKRGENPLKGSKLAYWAIYIYVYLHPVCDPPKPSFLDSFCGIYEESMESQKHFLHIWVFWGTKVHPPPPFMSENSNFLNILV